MKKIISILIALTMLVSMVPAAFAEGEMVYTFGPDGSSNVPLVTDSLKEDFSVERVIEGTSYYLSSTYFSSYGERGWKIVDADESMIKIAPSYSTGFRLYGSGKLIQSNYNESYPRTFRVALSLDAPETAGFYVPVLSGGSSAKVTSQFFNMYAGLYETGKNSVDDYADAKHLIEMDWETPSWSIVVQTGKSAVYTKADDEVVFVVEALDNSKSQKVNSITLNPILNPVMKTVIENADSTTSSALSVELAADAASNSQAVTLSTLVSGTDVTDMPVSDNFITYKSSDEDVATVSADGTITAVGTGTATIYAESSDKKYSSIEKGITITVTAPAVPEDDEALSNAFDAKEETVNTYVESTVTGLTDDTTIEAVKNSDGTFTLTAPEIKENAKFLYWAKGMKSNKKIVSFSNKLEDYMPEEDGKNYLIAVYEGDVSDTAEYYNANGQRIATVTEPELPSMAGYGKATGWARYGETNIYVAEYGNKTQPDNVKVTVDGKEQTVPYGTEIICTADSTKENFKCWTKSDINGKTEIVSANETYKFKAWETCTVTAIYEEHTYKGSKIKIILDTFTAGASTAVMAEFIGLDNAVEKGIIYGSTRIAMTKPGNQFTVTAEDGGTFTGYAIIRNETDGYTMITDGTISVAAGQ